jgi:AcrR family transcriptional regulator
MDTQSPSRRRRSRAEARAETRSAILVVARRLFAERGYRGASLDAIAEAAGFSKGAVYSNWPSKEALFLDLLDATQADDGSQGLSTEPSGWAIATLDFFIEAIGNVETRLALADRYRAARASAGAGMGQGRDDPAWATWEEIATAAMALGSGLIIQAAIDDEAVDPSLMGRVMQRLMEPSRE